MKIEKEDGTKSDEEKKADETIFQEYGSTLILKEDLDIDNMLGVPNL